MSRRSQRENTRTVTGNGTNPDTTVTVSRVHRDGVYVRVSTIGKDGVRPFVLVPGIGVASNYFERLAPKLNEFGPVHALDLPGFGGVPHPGSALSIPQFADLVGAAIDELELDDPILVGHSMGSQVVADLASRRPKLSTVVLIGPVVPPEERSIPRAAIRFLRAAWHEPGRVKFLAMSSYLLCGVKWFSRVLPKMIHFPVEERYPKIRANTLVIRGEFDAVAPRDWVERIGELLPHSVLREIPTAAHSVMYAHADTVADLCVEHARLPDNAADDNTLRRASIAADDSDGDGDVDVLKAAAGRLTEAVGLVTGDDQKIADGKTQHAEATSESGN